MILNHELLETYKLWHSKARAALTVEVWQRTKGVVVSGPFKGMNILPESKWGDGDYANKLLGLYESELYDIVEKEIAAEHDFILNVGCAEGFYGIGLAQRTGLPTALVDIDADSLAIARKNAEANMVAGVEYINQSSPELIENLLSLFAKPFLVMDCEGYEEQYLDLSTVPSLAKTTVLVETHDCFRAGITERLEARFGATHEVVRVSQGAKNPYIDIIADFNDHEKLALACESRPSTMYWLYLVPKA
jgi:hypothetical protein